MKWRNFIQQALINLRAAKLRSCLAVLGVLVGTAAVVALVNSGQLATENALLQFKALGTDLLAVSIYQKQKSSSAHQESITLQQWRDLPEQIPDILKVAPYSASYQPMSFQGVELKGPVLGADEALADIVQIELAQGAFVSFVDAFEHYCVIGDTIAQQMKRQGAFSPIGQPLRIGQTLYTIIGIAKPWQENSFFNEDINQAVIIPISGMVLINPDNKMNHAVFKLKSGSNIDVVIADLKQRLAPNASGLGLYIRSAKQIIASMESQGRIFTWLLGIIGGISLLVGGIGIMNVMLVSVSERKKEIGIRKAVGAKNREIQRLFLTESVLLSLLGGLLGITLGLLFTAGVAWINHWTFVWYWTPSLVGFVISLSAGIFFGYYPAKRASLLDPIVTLRSEI